MQPGSHNVASPEENSALATWVDRAAPPGSGRYYALLHDNNSIATSTILALISIWSNLCFSNREIEAARKQLEWWQLELEKTTPIHPVTSALHNQDPVRYEYATPYLKEVLRGYGSLLLEGSPSRAEPAKLFHERTGAMGAMAIAGPLTQESSKLTLEKAGIALSQFRCIRHVYKHASNGLLCLPFEAMSNAGVSPTDIVPGRYTANLRTFLQEQLSSVNDAFELFFESSTGDPEQRFLFVYSKLQQRLLVSYQRDLTKLDDAGFRLTPLRNFWTAWRAQRQFAAL